MNLDRHIDLLQWPRKSPIIHTYLSYLETLNTIV